MSGGDSVSFMIVSHSYLIQSVSGENVTNSSALTLAFSRRQLILHVHMSQTSGIVCLFLEHSSYLTQYKKSLWDSEWGKKQHTPGRMRQIRQTLPSYRHRGEKVGYKYTSDDVML